MRQQDQDDQSLRARVRPCERHMRHSLDPCPRHGGACEEEQPWIRWALPAVFVASTAIWLVLFVLLL